MLEGLGGTDHHWTQRKLKNQAAQIPRKYLPNRFKWLRSVKRSHTDVGFLLNHSNYYYRVTLASFSTLYRAGFPEGLTAFSIIPHLIKP